MATVFSNFKIENTSTVLDSIPILSISQANQQATAGHQLRFDDNVKHPTVTLHSYRDMDITAHGEHKTTVGKNMTTTLTQGNYLQQTEKDLHLYSDKGIHLINGQSRISITPTDITIESDEIGFHGPKPVKPMAPIIKKDKTLEPVITIDALPNQRHEDNKQNDDWDYVLGLGTALWRGTQSIGESLVLGTEEMGDMMGVAGINKAGQAWGANWQLLEFLGKTTKVIIEKRNPLYDMIKLVIDSYIKLLPKCALLHLTKQAGYELAYLTGRYTIGQKVVKYLVNYVSKKIFTKILATKFFHELEKKAILAGAAGATDVGFVVTAILFESVVKESEMAANRLAKENDVLYKKLAKENLIGGYFIIEKIVKRYIIAINRYHTDSEQFTQQAKRMYCDN